MEFSNNKEVLTIFDKRGKVVTLATKLAALSGEQIKDFFNVRLNKIPRHLNSLALYKVLNDKIPTLNSLSLTKDMFTKLQSYKDFTEFQLQTLFEKICDDEDFLQYRINLWTLILRNYDVINLLDGEVQYLSKVKKLKVEDFSSYNRFLFEVSEDVNKCFDGVQSKKLEEIFNNTFSSDELRRLAEKYGFTISQRLKKDEFSDYLKQILKSKKKLTAALSKEIDGMTVVQLNSLCQVHEVTLSSNLKKHEIIYLLLFLIKKNKLATSEIKGISDTWGITPLEFTVDLDKIDNFGRGEAKEVIILPSDEVFEEEQPVEENKETSKDELLKEIAKKLGLLPDEEKPAEEPKEEDKKPVTKKPATKKVEPKASNSANQMSPAERLALARQRKQELALERKLEEERKALEEERKALEEERRILEEQALENERKEKEKLQEILNKLLQSQQQPAEVVEETPVLEDEIIDEEIDSEPEISALVEDNVGEEIVEDSFDEIEDDAEFEDEIDETLDEVEIETVEPEIDDLTDENQEQNPIEETLEDEEIDETLEVTPIEEVIEDEEVTLEEESVSESLEEVELKDESYDESFNPNEDTNVTEVIDNPYYHNKKFAPKKKTGLKVVLTILAAILIFGAGIFASRFLK